MTTRAVADRGNTAVTGVERRAHAAGGDGSSRTAIVLVVSSSAADGRARDTTGPTIARALRSWGLDAEDPIVIADGAPVGRTIAWAAEHFDLIITTGGTGVTPDDRTPEETASLLDRQIPGIPELLRRLGTEAGVPTAVLSRGLAGTIGRSLVINLPGSPGAVAGALDVLGDIVPHALAQLGSPARARRRHPARALSRREAEEILEMPAAWTAPPPDRPRAGGEGDATVVELPRPGRDGDEQADEPGDDPGEGRS
nr:MogA/MoaB family molybdenum cofactor biosynthesis protein [Sediminivirga luteola]